MNRGLALLASTVALGCADRGSVSGQLLDCEAREHAWADVVVHYDPTLLGGAAPTVVEFADPEMALGPPDYVIGSGVGAVALGYGGVIELGFDECLLSTSGDASPDLVIHEIGPDKERTFVALAPLDPSGFDPDALVGDGYYFATDVAGSTVEIDLDALYGLTEPTVFIGIQLVDDPDSGTHEPETPGADIDAVEILHPVTP